MLMIMIMNLYKTIEEYSKALYIKLKIGTHCVHVSTTMLTKCVGEGMGKLIRNNQVQVAEVLPLYAKGTGQQGVC